MSSLPSASDVYIGHWTNWSKGPVWGSTITVSSTTGAVIVAFIALYVQISGVHIWNLVTFLFYQSRVTDQPRTGLFHQQQVLLRNSESPLSTAVGFLRLGWFWRPYGNGILVRNSLPSVVGLLYAAGVVIAAIFSSYAVNNNDLEVLAQSPYCGFWSTIKRTESTTQSSTDAGLAQNARWSQMLDSSTVYSRSCYGEKAAMHAPQCGVYTSPHIEWATNYNATCPFAKGECVGTETSAMEMDTGILDLAAFGFNAPKGSRVGLRKVTNCAPLHPLKYISYANATDDVDQINIVPLPGEQVAHWDYGEDRTGQIATGTAWMSTYAKAKMRAYRLVGVRSFSGGGNFSDFEARPEFHRDDADTTIFFLEGNDMVFDRPVDDPFFSAHVARHFKSSYDAGTSYQADYPAGIVGCVEQYQFCDMGSPSNCTPLNGIMGSYEATKSLPLNDIQGLTVDLLYDIIFNWFTTIAMVSYSTPPKLQALTKVEGGIQTPLPNNQWQVELLDWHGTVMSGIQQYLVSHATGPDNPTWREFFVSENNSASQGLCHAQKVRVSGGYSNVDVFGLSFILAFGGVGILLSLMLKHLGMWIQKKRSPVDQGKNVAWIQDDLFQVHRAAYQARGLGTWKGEGNMVPLTEPGDVFESHWAYDLEAGKVEEIKMTERPPATDEGSSRESVTASDGGEEETLGSRAEEDCKAPEWKGTSRSDSCSAGQSP